MPLFGHTSRKRWTWDLISGNLSWLPWLPWQHIEGKFPDCWQKQQDGKECWELLAMKYIMGIGKKRQSVNLFWFYNFSPQTQHNRQRLSCFAIREPLATYGYWAFEMGLVWIWMCYKWKTCIRFEHTMRKNTYKIFFILYYMNHMLYSVKW